MLDPAYQLTILRKHYALNPLKRNPFKGLAAKDCIEYIKNFSLRTYVPLKNSVKTSTKTTAQHMPFFRPVAERRSFNPVVLTKSGGGIKQEI